MKFNARKVITLLHESGLLYQNKTLERHAYNAVRTGDYQGLKAFLYRNRWILRRAKEILITQQRLKELVPFEIPSQDDFQGNIPVGVINEKNETFRLSETDLTQHLSIWGRSGAGKSVLLTVLLASLFFVSRLAKIFIFDPQREYRKLANVIEDFIVITPKNLNLNFFEPPTRKMNPMDWAQIISEIIQLESRFMTHSKNVLFDILTRLYRKMGVLDGSENYPTAADILKELEILKEKAREMRDYRIMDSYNVLINRFLDFVNLEIFSVKKSVPLEAMMSRNIIFETENLKSETYSTIVSTLLGKIYFYRFYHSFDHLILSVIEEARKVMNAKRDRDFNITSDPYIVELFTKSRKFQLAYAVISQEPSSISQVIKANCGTQFLLSLFEGNEVQAAAKSMNLSKEQLDFFYREIKVGRGLCRYSGYPYPFIIQIPFIPLPDAPTDEEIEAKAQDWFREIGYNPADDSEITTEQAEESSNKGFNIDDIAGDEAQAQSHEKPRDETVNHAQAMLHHLSKHPFTQYSSLLKHLELHSDKGIRARKYLEENGLIIVHADIRTGKRSKGMFMELTPEAYQQTGGRPPKGKGSFKHKVYQNYVAEWLKSQGKKSAIELSLFGKSIDVFAYKEKTAYEITLHFDNLVENIKKDFEAGVKFLVVVCEDTKSKNKAKQLIREHPELGDTEIKIISDFI